MAKLNRDQFRFLRHDTIGAEGAEQDQDFLFECFVDTGDLDALKDTENPKSIVLGRTGSGKTALLLLLRQQEKNVAGLEPDQLALQYLANSTILPHLERLGVRLDIFYRLLWQHILAVELIKLKYGMHSKADQDHLFARLRERIFGDAKKRDALNYLVEWGEHFWEDTEYRIHEVTKKLERDVKADLGVKAKFLEGKLSATDKYSEEDKSEIVHRAQNVVNKVQIQRLARVITLLAGEVFSDPFPRYYVVVDRLDESWVDDPLRYRLIRALIETIGEFRKFTGAKAIIALRHDLLDRVFRYTRDSGFQEEKYQPLILRLRWGQEQLLTLLDKRLNKLVKRQYTKEPVSLSDLFPSRVNTMDTSEYMICRTMFRPRDVIQFGNCCIELAEDRSGFTAEMVRDAEAEYSKLRFRSLGDEWIGTYPYLLRGADILRRRPPRFPLSQITEQETERVCLSAFDYYSLGRQGRIGTWAVEVLEGHLTLDEFRTRLVKVFYDVGMVGLRVGTSTPVSWSFRNSDILRLSEITDDARLEICPMLYRVLGTALNRT